MNLSELTAISPIDGRYRNKIQELAAYFSEFALIKYRVHVEIEYFIFLVEQQIPEVKDFDHKDFFRLRDIHQKFSTDDAQRVKEIEKTINHDVKAVEYFLKSKFDEFGFGKYKEFIHFGLTSQDINNTAIPLSLKEFMHEHFIPAIGNLRDILTKMSEEWQNVPMLAHTHGQPASPTLLGKEIMVFVERIDNQLKLLEHLHCYAKFGGATGNFNAHYAAYPEMDWNNFGNEFIHNKLRLIRQQHTTQIEHYDGMAAIFDNIKRINTILIDLCRDMWTYISMEYFRQKVNKDEVGSSAMPHKVNPIDFENAEGNLGVANAIFEHLSAKLPISRLQRDLTDSTVLRNIGVPFAHSIIALDSIKKGLGKLLLNESKLNQDLEKNWIVVAEAIQTILRRNEYPQPYEKLKELTRTNDKITKDVIHRFIDSLDVSNEIKVQLKKISPQTYTGKPSAAK